MTMSNNVTHGQFGDTTLTKVFVGGLAWETPKEALREHFDKYGEILEAVLISDKLTGRSKGYGFVTFKEPEEAKKACEDATPVINGRRANCNLASLGARRPRSASNTTPPPQRGSNGGGARSMSPAPAPANHVQWYYPAPTGTPATPFHHQHHQAVPFYGYSPTYIASDMSYNHKVGYTGGAYMNGHYSAPQVYPAQPMVGHNTLMPMYPLYYHHHHQSHTMGLPTHIYSPTMAGHVAAAGGSASTASASHHHPPPFLLRQEVEAVEEMRVVEIEPFIIFHSSDEEFIAVESTVRVFQKVCEVGEGAESSVLHREALRHHAHLLARLQRFIN